MTVLENGLNEDNALIILMATYKLNAMKIIRITRRFIMRRRKCPYMKSHWGHLLLGHPKIFVIVAKIMMEIDVEYDDNVFTTFVVKEGTIRSNYCLLYCDLL